MKIVNALSLSGGGSRGVMSLYQVNYLFNKMGGSFFRNFDYMTGCSTGALSVALFAMGHTPSEVIFIYEKELPKIFNSGCLRQVRDLSKYDNTYLKDLAHRLIGNVKLGDLKQNIIIPTINISGDRPETKIFKSHDPKDADYLLVDVVLASASAPTYFPAYNINGEYYIDGGMSSNNPSDIVLKECQAAQADVINILSITTGNSKDVLTRKEIKGSLRSVPDLIDTMLATQDSKSHGNVVFEYQIRQAKGTYRRCESLIVNSSGKMDDVSKANIKAMKADGELSVLKNRGDLDIFYLSTLK